MYSNTGARVSVDSLSPSTSSATRGEFPFHSKPSRSPHRPGTRRDSTASSIHSVGGALDTSSTTWANAVLESGQNAISTLLQPPIVRTGLLPHTIAPASSAHKPPTARDIPPVTLTNIPHVDTSEFKTYLSQIGSDRSFTLARNLRALGPKDVEELLEKIYIGITETLRRLNTQVKTLLDVAYSVGDSSLAGMKSPPLKFPPFSPTGQAISSAALDAQEEIHRALDLPNLVGQAVDIAQDKIVKLLRVRTEQTRQLSLARFLRYFMLNLHFANECEAISGRSGTVLKNVVNGHIKDFVQSHGDAEMQKLAQGMDADQWNAVDFTERDTELLAHILESSTRDAPAWLESTMIHLPYSDDDDIKDNKDSNGLGDDHQANGAGKTKTRSATIESESFVLPNSAVLCMNGIAQFLHLTTAIPSMTADVSTSLITYLKMFNSRCTQLILGAGATRSAGLKNINARNLSLASQALAFIAMLIPHIREFVRRHSTSSGPGLSNTMGEFDKVRRLYQEHQNSIYDKLVEIMSARASAGAKKMKDVGWDVAVANGSGSVNAEDDERAANDYMRTVTKETTQLHRALTKNLPEATVRLIMLPVFKAYKNTFGEAFKAAEPKTEAGRDSMIRDIGFFSNRLGKMDGFGDTGDFLTSVINAKEINGLTREAAAQEAASPAKPEQQESAEKMSSEADVQNEEAEASAGDGAAQEIGNEVAEEQSTTQATGCCGAVSH
ncbi:hypothetical protein P8C59_001274 [Phyllachora maydis]|uniref:Vacuolar protein sorting-associated protein 54 C-terminal domain-containing protein n=1 Tax=Phyllachora maydis TaxID=1825666 RepID=A0AAD9HZ28_9PEZI|nr:hypothetical protein P8C59_001274 [Phyllachora maydis]